MTKGKKRSNREIKKPKQAKASPAPSAALEKGVSATSGVGKKKI